MTKVVQTTEVATKKNYGATTGVEMKTYTNESQRVYIGDQLRLNYGIIGTNVSISNPESLQFEESDVCVGNLLERTSEDEKSKTKERSDYSQYYYKQQSKVTIVGDLSKLGEDTFNLSPPNGKKPYLLIGKTFKEYTGLKQTRVVWNAVLGVGAFVASYFSNWK